MSSGQERPAEVLQQVSAQKDESQRVFPGEQVRLRGTRRELIGVWEKGRRAEVSGRKAEASVSVCGRIFV